MKNGLPKKQKPAAATPDKKPKLAGGQGHLHEQIFMQLPEPVILINQQQKIHLANEGACRLFGWGRKAIIDKPLKKLVDLDGKTSSKIKKKTKEEDVLLRGWKKNGKCFFFKRTLSPGIVVAGNTFDLWIIREEKEAFSVERKLNWLINNTEESFILLDTSLRIITYNQRFSTLYKQYFGIEVERGRHILDYAQQSRKKQLNQLYAQVLKGNSQRSEVVIDHPREGRLYFSLLYHPARDENRELIGVFVTASNDTQRRRAEEKEQLANRLLKETLHSLNERVKEQACLHQISSLGNQSNSIEALLEEAVRLIPDGLQYPEITEVRIDFADKRYSTPGFKKSKYTLSATAQIWGQRPLDLTIVYRTAKPIPEPVFLVEEHRLAEAIAGHLRLKIEQILVQQQVETSREQLRKIMDSSLDMICTMDANGVWLKVSGACKKLLDYEPGEMEGKHFEYFLYKEDIGKTVEAAAIIRQGQDMTNFENHYVHKNGQLIPLIWSARWDEKDQVYYTVARDGTASKAVKKAMADERLRYIELFRNAPDFICILHLQDWLVEFTNPLFDNLVRRGKVLGKSLFELLDFHEAQTKLTKGLQHVAKTGEVFIMRDLKVRPALRKDEENRFVNIVAQPYRSPDNQVIGVIVYGTDITPQMEARQQLLDSEQNYRNLFMENPYPMWLIEPGTFRFIEVNKEAIRRYGYSRREFLKMTLRDMKPEEENAILDKLPWQQERGSEVFRGISRHITKSGALIYADVNSHIISYSGRNVILASASDITDQLEAEQSLRRIQANQEALINSTDDLVWSVDPDYRLIAANSAFVESLKQSTGMELKPGDNLLLFGNFPNDFIHLWKMQYDRCLGGEAFESEIHTPAGPNYPETWTQIRFNPIYGTEGIIGVACFSRDVTESKKTEQRILSINQKLETAQQIARLGYWELDVLNQKLFWTKQVYSIWGVDPEKTETSYEFFIKSIHPDDLEEFYARQKEAWIPGGKLDFEHRIILPDGSTRFVHEKGEIIRNEAGEPIRLEGTVQDITERKLALSRLEESEEQYRYLFMKSPMPKWIYELDSLKILEVNEAAIKKYGYSREQFLSMTIKDIRPVEDVGRLIDINKNITPGTTIHFGQWRHRKANGELLHVEVSGHMTTHQGREVMMVVSMDVTERVKATEQLAQSNERFEYVAKATFDAIWDWNLQTDHLYWGDGFETLFGYTLESNDVDINSWSDHIHPDDREMVIADVTRFIGETKESLWTMEYRFQRANGTYAYVIDKGLVIRDEQGRGLRMIGALSDVSRLKEIELRLASERNLLRILVDTLPDYVYVKDAQARHILNNKKMLQLLGATTEEETIGKRLDELMPADLAQIYLVDDWEVLQTREPIYNKLEPLILPNGERRWLSTSKIPVLDSNGSVSAIVGISRDITETREVQHERELALRINQAFAENESLENSLLSMLEECCQHFRQDLAEVWVVNSDRNLIRLSAIYSITNQVVDNDAGIAFVKGEGLPGWAWENEQPLYISELQQDDAYKRKNFAHANQLRRATAIPVHFNRQVIAVLVFYESNLNKTAAAPILMGKRLLAQIAGDIQRKKSESELNRFFTYAPELLCVAGPDGYFKKVNPAFTRLLGYSEEEMLSRPFTDFVHPDDLSNTLNEIKDATSTRVSYSFVNRYRTKDGNWKWISWSSSTPITADGLAFGYGKDITELKQAETSLLLYKKVIEMSRDGIGIINIVNGEVYTNKSFNELIQLNEGEIKGMEDAIDLYEDKEQARAMFQTLGSGKYWNGDVQLRSRTGELIDFYLSAGPVMDEQGKQIALFGVHTDIRERKKLERRLLDYNSRITNILESITDGFFSVDHEWKVTYWNREAERLLQRKRAEMLGQNLWNKFADAMSLQFYSEYHRAVSEKTSVHFEEFFPPLDVWLEVSAYPSQDGLSVYFKDITERKKADEAIRLSNERYDLVARATSDAIWDWDLVTGRTVRTGDGFTALFGYDKEDANNDPGFWSKRVHPEDLPRVQASHAQVFSDPEAIFWEEEYRFLKSNGMYAWVYDKGTIIRNGQGEAIRMIGATQDITQQKEQVNEIIRIQQNLDTLINSTSDLIWSVDGDMRIISANRAFCDSIAQLTGKQVVEGMLLYDESFPQEVSEFWHQRYQKALSGEGFSVEDAFIYPGKEEKQHAIITFTPIFDKVGDVRGVACFAKNVTAIKQSAEQLEELNRQLLRKTEELAASNVELERFAYVASHDLQEPLRMVSSFLQLLKKKYNTQLDETGQGYIDFAVDGAERMKRLIKDLLDYSRLDSKEDDLDDTDMNQVVQEVIYTLGERIQKQNAVVDTGPLPVLPKTHRTQLFQLMQNLISNGLKYNRTEQPTVSVHALEQADHWLFEVRDNGIGIDPKYFDKIFVIFQRLHNRTQYSGTGIGLAVCKKIVERAGGMIWVKSVPDSGSSFYFTIPK